jgi:hypothetical protein
MRHGHAARREAVGVHAEPVVLRRDRDAAGLDVFHRMVCTAVAELEFIGLCPECKPGKLVPQADAENRQFAQKVPDRLDCIRYCGGISRTIAQKNAVRLICQCLACGG